MTSTADASKSGKTEWREFKVDLWATDMNDVEIGIMKDTEHRAQSRQFTKDMEVFGQVVDGGDRKGIFGFREDIWDKEEALKKRLVIKLFTEDMNWLGSLDLMMGRSVQLTLGAGGFPVTAFSINLARHEQIVQVERSARRWPLQTEAFSFFLLPPDEPARFYTLKKKRISFGGDYTIVSQTGETIGHLNGKVVNIGGAWKVKLDPAHANAAMEHTLKLFCSMLRFNSKLRKHVKTQAKHMANGEIKADLDYQETELYMNPRRTK